ncbi:hypothetical protein ZOSMA_15G00570 [Zostera marina]|uniref:BHLH domain-containing protein n=1 Tax=Zostera marina TaxID=29655 RepID=A0A0K9PUV8_ZOSMR|nr:hypothetical protein ZOSMA_15G00570 [Zostera marina]
MVGTNQYLPFMFSSSTTRDVRNTIINIPTKIQEPSPSIYSNDDSTFEFLREFFSEDSLNQLQINKTAPPLPENKDPAITLSEKPPIPNPICRQMSEPEYYDDGDLNRLHFPFLPVGIASTIDGLYRPAVNGASNNPDEPVYGSYLTEIDDYHARNGETTNVVIDKPAEPFFSVVQPELQQFHVGSSLNTNGPSMTAQSVAARQRPYHARNGETTNAVIDKPAEPFFSVVQPELQQFHVGSSLNTNGPSMTAQSVAARQRRRKISNKTQDLEKLIPGGHRMNTGEMLLSAEKYIKFLQAQVGMLSLMKQQQHDRDHNYHNRNPTECRRTMGEDGRIQRLVMSTDVQEKLYRAKKCIVSKEIVDILGKDPSIFFQSSISRDFSTFIKTLKSPQRLNHP